MKIALQISTANLGDIVIEETEDKTTTNKKDQQAILTELIFEVLRKVQAVYQIPQDMLDLGDYTSAEDRFHEERKTAKPSSAERNRQRHFSANSHVQEEPSPVKDDIEEVDSDEKYDEYVDITDEEMDLILLFRKMARKE